MLYLRSFLHRVRLAEVVSRWVVNKPQPDDVRVLKEIVNFNSYSARLWVDTFATDIFSKLHGRTPFSFLCKTKGQLKDFITEHPRYVSPRVDELLRDYREKPENFYRGTPFDGRVYCIENGDGSPLYVGSTRIKRFRRIAEKGSRRIVDYMMERIRANADALAEERAGRRGIPKDLLITSAEEMVAEYLRGEQRLLQAIRQGSIHHEFPILSIPDVVGIKVITEGEEYNRLLELLNGMEGCDLLEIEEHSGRYNATNLRVAYRIQRDDLRARCPEEAAVRLFAQRGMAHDQVREHYREFIDQAEDTVLLEIIVSNFQEFLESEIGRSMHEDRIVQQRAERDYNSHLATNILYLMDYILALCLSPLETGVDEVPIKLWVKYMPDTIDHVVRGLFRIPVDASFDDMNGADVGQWQPAIARIVA